MSCIRHRRGFSLVEMLVVIAVIGIMAAIAVAFIGHLNYKALQAKDQRNAQSIVSMATAACASGVELPGPEARDVVDALAEGIAAPAGSSLSDTVFRVPNLSEQDREGVVSHVEWNADAACLVYKPQF